MSTNEVTIPMRLLSMAVDHFVMSFLLLVIMFPVMIFGITLPYSIYVGIPVFALYFCKDSFGGKSIAKRIFKLQVVNYKTGLPAIPFQCMIRNLFCIFWFVEVIIILFNPGRRIGDFIAFTKVVPEVNKKPEKIHVSGIIFTYIFTCAVLYGVYFLFLDNLFSKYYGLL